MISLKIARRAYQRASQTALAAFTEEILKRMNGVAAYETLQSFVQPLEGLLETYGQTLAAARNRGRMEVVAKNHAQTALIDQLNRVTTALELLARQDEQLIVNAGFSVRVPAPTGFSGKLPKPIIARASSTGNRGEVRISLDTQVPSGVASNYALEYSVDRLNGWQNGTYHSRRNFVATDLPAAPELWLRIKTIGRGGKQSDWSEPVIVGVL